MRRAALAFALALGCGVKGPPLPPLREAALADGGPSQPPAAPAPPSSASPPSSTSVEPTPPSWYPPPSAAPERQPQQPRDGGTP